MTPLCAEAAPSQFRECKLSKDVQQRRRFCRPRVRGSLYICPQWRGLRVDLLVCYSGCSDTPTIDLLDIFWSVVANITIIQVVYFPAPNYGRYPSQRFIGLLPNNKEARFSYVLAILSCDSMAAPAVKWASTAQLHQLQWLHLLL